MPPQINSALRSRTCLSTHAKAAKPCPLESLTGEFLTNVGPLLVVVVYAPTDQFSTEEQDLPSTRILKVSQPTQRGSAL